MEVTVAILSYVLTILIPINGLLYLGARAERKRIRSLLISLWQVKRGGRYK